MAAIIDFVEWESGNDTVFAWKFPHSNLSTKTQLLVRDAQEALVYADGTLLGRFGPGRHTLTTENLPILRSLYGLPFGGKNPFKAEVWYINKLTRLTLDWKVDNIANHDADYNTMIPLRAWGTFSVKISDAERFMKEVVGAATEFNAGMLNNLVRGEFNSKIKSALAQFLIGNHIGLKRINAYIDMMGDQLRPVLSSFWDIYGILLSSFYFTEVEIDTATEIGAEAARGIASQSNQAISGHTWQQAEMFGLARDAVNNVGGGEGGLLGAVLATSMMGNMAGGGSAMQPQYQQPSFTPVQGAGTPGATGQTPVREVFCSNCSRKFQNTMKFCPHCGDIYRPCPKCGSDNDEHAKRCVSCGANLQGQDNQVCSNCHMPVPSGAAFCPNCGNPQNEGKCSRCGVALNGAKFCPSCGQKNG